MVAKQVLSGLALLMLSAATSAEPVYDTAEPESADQLVNYNDPDAIDVYRGGQGSAETLDPWAVPDQNTDDAQILEDQMNPDPTIEYDQQLYGE